MKLLKDVAEVVPHRSFGQVKLSCDLGSRRVPAGGGKDVALGEGTDADQGCQYELTITDKGMIGVASTATFQDVAMSTD